ncbi:MAG: DUF2281 domain-containing protein [Pyrinomonadaceae bacterium MAG19_C2-C3]|nr:DUF2281 domain-containing protein [Pyrinomonadaceae bacterium MAG19_C2-C3]
MSTNLVEEAMSKMGSLPYDKQQEVLDFVEFIAQKSESQNKIPRRSLRGLWADLGLEVTAEDIDEARREMWSNFPHEDIL